jgi:hypothetical protein
VCRPCCASAQVEGGGGALLQRHIKGTGGMHRASMKAWHKKSCIPCLPPSKHPQPACWVRHRAPSQAEQGDQQAGQGLQPSENSEDLDLAC